MKRKYRVSILVFAVCLLLAGATSCTRLKARDQLNKGVSAYRSAQYAEAVEYFKKSIELDPEFLTARLYLATSYYSQYIPGSMSSENDRMATSAHDEFLKVLEIEPNNAVALATVASLFFHQNKYDEAEDWYEKLIAAAPDNKEAYYTLGVIAWTRTFQKRMEARSGIGMRPEDPGPIKDDKVREELKQANLPIIESGLRHLEEALQVDAEYDDAMAYLNLLYRERADLADSEDQYESDISTADDWVDKTLDTKKIKAMRSTSGAFDEAVAE